MLACESLHPPSFSPFLRLASTSATAKRSNRSIQALPKGKQVSPSKGAGKQRGRIRALPTKKPLAPLPPSTTTQYSSLSFSGASTAPAPEPIPITRSNSNYAFYFDPITRLPVRREIPVETRFWRIEGGLKVYKPLTPGLRGRKEPALTDHWDGKPVQRLTVRKHRSGGRNKTGRVVVRGRGGGGPKAIRVVDWRRAVPGPHRVVRLEKDPNRSATLALLRNESTNELSYVLATEGIKQGDVLQSFVKGLDNHGWEFVPPPPLPKSHLLRPGNVFLLQDLPVGSVVNSLSLSPNGPAKLCRSAGSSAQLLQIQADGKFAMVRLASGETRLVPKDCSAVLGRVANAEHHRTIIGTAGANRRRGYRPKVRGVAMNPTDHPHGGTRNRKGNRQPVSEKGVLAKGGRTGRRNPLVITPRWKGKK
ncbi:hypothetical protein M427DRAFT_96206 [Gonapodya prolifera JEL478]|uniref:Uncharacterized protein n=1 Tax=Gonapodya prolifera (strain JEL478) TaxID=1344416 RepID=A0A139AND5_GONPJ|nr:hypothetical protein M427DRAFT_96206 [Gonapodya prolifera JEL478]|eukprot:KXS18246.1 hypothetical protein M427DRAFT_96206 [Gonapodya prolifera JEL478]